MQEDFIKEIPVRVSDGTETLLRQYRLFVIMETVSGEGGRIGERGFRYYLNDTQESVTRIGEHKFRMLNGIIVNVIVT